MEYVVLDKSFLLGASQARVLEVANGRRLVMIHSLMDELLYDESPKGRKERAMCFKKLPHGQDPVELVEVGRIFHHEKTVREAAHSIDRFFEPRGFEFNHGLPDPDFTPNEACRNSFASSREELREEAQDWRRMTKELPVIFPQLQDIGLGDLKNPKVIQARSRVVQDPEIVRTFWSKARRPNWASPEDLAQTWATFRWIQLSLLYLIDSWARYGPERIDTAKEEVLMHDALDLNYALVGLTVGKLASNDQRLIGLFNEVLPEGIVFRP